MASILNITNGDSAVDVLKAAAVPGEFLPWRDVLHDGPVPAGLLLEKLSQIRARFIIDQGWGTPEIVRRGFVERDRRLQSHQRHAKVILWFEHDLYDQLQILQILDWFAAHPPEATKLAMICTEQYLGLATPDQIQDLVPYEAEITANYFAVAQKAWAAFRSPTPEKWQNLLGEDTSRLPFLEGAVLRLLEEYPDCESGLSRTVRNILEIVSRGVTQPGELFRCYQETEERRFMGDLSFEAILRRMLESDPALLALSSENKLTMPPGPDQKITLAKAGEAVLAGHGNWLDMVDIDHWIGGVHLIPRNVWCRDPESGRVTRRP